MADGVLYDSKTMHAPMLYCRNPCLKIYRTSFAKFLDHCKADECVLNDNFNIMCFFYQHYSGLDDAVFRNIQACRELTQKTRSSLGPNGRHYFCLHHLSAFYTYNFLT